jgi:thioredoxin-related protein
MEASMARVLPWLLLSIGMACRAADPVPSPHAIDVPKWFTESFLDFREDVADARRQGKRLMLYFGQDGCPYCKALMTVNFRQPDIVAKTRASFVAIALNLWGDREVTWVDGRRMTEKELGRVLQVQFTPTLLFFDEEARVVLRLNGYSPPEKFRVALDYVAGRKEKQLTFTEYLEKTAPSVAKPALTAQPFFEKGAPDLAKLVRGPRPVLVLFEQPSCAECAEMHRDGLQRSDVRELLTRFAVVQLDMRGERRVVTPTGEPLPERRWARALNVVYTPTLLFLDREGREIFRAEGYLKPFHLASTLDYVASGAYRGEPSFQRYIQKRADGLRAAGKPVDLWN